MQWVVADGATFRIIDWICHQMIKIHEHRSDEDH